MTRYITIADFLTGEEISRAVELYRSDRKNFHKRCKAEILEPVMDRINRDLGQENDAGYLAYAVEHVMVQLVK